MSPFNWLLYLGVADDLILQGTEAHCRSGVSRAYYGVFGEIRRTLETRGIRFKGENVHREVIEWLRNQPDNATVQIGLELDRLRLERNRADYDAMQNFTQSRAKKSLLGARRIATTTADL